jgi:hypothetical protein
MPLPTEKSKPTLGVENLKALLYGPWKIGKTSLLAELDPDHTLFIATEPGHGGVEVFKEDCPSWEKFREIGTDLSKGKHPFRLAVVDTADSLLRYCGDHVLAGLGGNRTGYVHASDFEYGKGWEAITSEVRLRVAKLCSLGIGVVFVSHAKEGIKKDRVGREITVVQPDIGLKGARNWLLGFVDHIWYATSETTEDGDRRLIHTTPTENYEAGGRGVPLPDPIEMGASPQEAAKNLKAALAAATKQLQKPKQEKAKSAAAAQPEAAAA